MTAQQQIQGIDAIGEVNTWPYDRERGRWSVEHCGYTAHVEVHDGHYLWMLEHERYGVLMAWAPAGSKAKAKEDAFAYWRAHLNAHTEHVHAE